MHEVILLRYMKNISTVVGSSSTLDMTVLILRGRRVAVPRYEHSNSDWAKKSTWRNFALSRDLYSFIPHRIKAMEDMRR